MVHLGEASRTAIRHAWVAAAFVLAVGCCLVFPAPTRARPNTIVAPGLTVRFFAAGHGDSIFLRTAAGHNVLIDAGMGSWTRHDHLVRRRIGPYFQRKGISRLDALIVTHPHNDHYGDPVALYRYARYRQLHTNADGAYFFSGYPFLLPWVAGRPVAVKTLIRGNFLSFGSLRLDVLHPPAGGSHPSTIKSQSEQNNRSLVIRVTFGRVRFLLTGDLKASGERRMLAVGLPGRADVLKLGHHGYGCTTEPWLAAVRPRYAVQTCCSGPWRNRRINPVMRRLARRSVTVFRTDKHRDVEFVTDGIRLQVRTINNFTGLGRRHRKLARQMEESERRTTRARLRRRVKRLRKKQRQIERAHARKLRRRARAARRSARRSLRLETRRQSRLNRMRKRQARKARRAQRARRRALRRRARKRAPRRTVRSGRRRSG